MARRIRLGETRPEADPTDPEGFRALQAKLGPGLGATRTGASLYDLPPGQAVCPYHYECSEEEWALVLEGRVTVRTPEGAEELAPLDLVFFPVGPEGAHQLRNDSDAPARLLMWSEVVLPAVSVYPDSDKIGVHTPGRRDDVIVRRESGVGYYDREVPPA